MKDFIISLLATVITGTLVSALFPKSKIEKPLLFLCGAVVTVSVIALFMNFPNGALTAFSLPDTNETFYTDNSESFYESAVGKTLENELSEAVFDYIGEYPENVSISVKFENGEFAVTLASITVKYGNGENIHDYLYKKTGLDVIIYESGE